MRGRPVLYGPAGLAALVGLSLVACSGSGTPAGPAPTPAPPVFQVPSGVSPLVASMYQQLQTYIGSALRDMQDTLPRNPQAAVQIGAKIAMLQRTTLAVEVANGRLFAETSAASIDGRTIAIAVLFPEERLRGEAVAAIDRVAHALPVLERFMDTPFPTGSLRVWYGFVVGLSGGNGLIDVEDRTSYQSRPSVTLPYDAGLDHELAHGYIGNESLTQFLELYVFNVLGAGSTAVDAWTHRRGYPGPDDGNTGVAAVIDVYLLMGHEAMSRGYKATYPLRPPYGDPIPPAVQQAFAEQAPPELRAAVLEKLGRVTF